MAKPNMTPVKTPMPNQDPAVRAHNFEEVALGYTEEMAHEEATRCLNCKHRPCVSGCPVNVRIPDFIAKVAEGDYEGAYQVITSTNALPAISGRVCPQESQCESKCVRGIKGEPVGIGRLERFVADWHRIHNADEKPAKPQPNGHKVAVVGSGPSSLTCASDLAKQGYQVTIFEAFHTAGGVLVYGIPEFRLPKAIVQGEVDKLKALGVEVMTNMVIGKVLSIDELFEDMGFEAVFIGTGAGLPRFMGIPGEGYAGVCSANEYLTRTNLYQPDEGISGGLRHTHPQEQGSGRRRRRQRGHGRLSLRPETGCGQGLHRLPPLHGGDARPERGDRARSGGGHRLPPALQPGRGHR